MTQWIKKSQPTPGDVHVNRPLTNISIAFLQEASGFVADQVFPNIPVQSQSDLYFLYDRGMFNRDQMEKRAPGTEADTVGFTTSTDNYRADVWSLAHDIPDQRRANADSPLQPDREATELLTHQALIRRDAEWVSNYFGSGIWTTTREGVASGPTGTQFLRWDEAGSTPIEDVEDAKITIAESTGFEPNIMVIDRRTWGTLRNHASIIDRVKASGGTGNDNPARLSVEAVAMVLDIPRLLVARAILNTANEGATNVHSFLVNKGALLVYSEPNPGIMKPSAGYTFSWVAMAPGASGAGISMRRFRLERIRSDRVEADMAFDQKLVSADMGFFFNATVS